MATHSSVLAWRIPWTEELGGLWSIQGHNQSDKTEATQHAISYTVHNFPLYTLLTGDLQI